MLDKRLTNISFTRAKELTYFLPRGMKNTISEEYIGQGSPYNLVTLSPTSFGKNQIDDLIQGFGIRYAHDFFYVFFKSLDFRLTFSLQINCARVKVK